MNSRLQNFPPVQLPLPDEAEDDEINLLDLLDVVLDSRWLIAAVTALALLLGGGYAFLSTPIYEANTLIQVEESKPGGGAASSALGEASSLFEIRSPATAEMEILRSRLVVGQAVQNLQLDLSIQPKYTPMIGGWLARRATEPSNPGLLGLSGYVSGNESLKVGAFDVPRKSEGERFSVLITAAGYDLISPKGETLAKGIFGTTLEFVDAGQKGQLLITEAVAKPGAEFYLKRFSRLGVIEELQRSLAITEQGRQSGVILTSLNGPEPEKIAWTLNEIGTLYVRQNVARKVAEAEKTLSFLGNNLPQLRARIEESENKFNQFRNRNSAFDLTTEAKLVLEQSVKLQTSLLELQQKRKDLETRFTAQHPSIQTVDAQIKNINAELGAINGRVKAFPNVEQDLLRLTRDLKVNTELYASLLNSSQQLQLVKEGKVGNVRIVDAAAVPEVPVKPQRQTVLALAGVLGLLAGLALAFLRNSLRPGIKDPADIEQHAGLHVFSTIPFSPDQALLVKKVKGKAAGNHVLAIAAPEDPAIESLRSLRTALQFAMLDAANNVVLITGPTPGIGKSFTSINFAAVLGAANKKVLLIDADLRKGHLNQYFGMARGKGLSELICSSVKLEDALHRQVLPNVDFLTTGQLPPNPAELLMTGTAQQLLRQVATQYDLVIIDSAPVLVASDTAILAPLVGAVFLVARAEVTSLSELQESVKRLAQSGAQAKGVIFNGLNITKRRYGYGMGNKYGKYRYTNYKY
ncbi:polysaccharide biosynthesis tyrosine autokinase [Polaromonas sp.]|uniref:polysaccharide biosynthesis tyrosine autokinase n=1 Tax=Polaromonas sp. TaxID=1869339 RepID=UPI00182CC9E5|nr:polysaccharide biosynthesis tyrosine autokinase [Polaromonas sp.]NMM06007.1 polysaccharide biosynthesis tyrosine autokinase [Polaromonas sp.]